MTVRVAATSVFGVILVILVLTGCTSINPSSALRNAATATGRSVPIRAGQTPASSVADPYPTVPGKVAIYASVSSNRVVADGHSFTSELVLVNGLSRPFSVPFACNGWLDVGLASATIEFQAMYTLIGCGAQSIPVGLTRLSRTVDTSYLSCIGDAHFTVTASIPACIGPHHDQTPTLPPGTYHLALDTSKIPSAVMPRPVIITLVKS